MRRLGTWVGGAVSGIVTYRLWKKRRRPTPASTPAPVAEDTDDRAEELRAKLAETRASGEVEPTERPEESAESVEERRRRVHEEGRAAIDRMNDGDQR